MFTHAATAGEHVRLALQELAAIQRGADPETAVEANRLISEARLLCNGIGALECALAGEGDQA